METFIQDLIKSYKFRIETTLMLSHQKWLNVDEIASLHKRLAQCELLVDMIEHYTHDNSFRLDFDNKSKEILWRCEQ